MHAHAVLNRVFCISFLAVNIVAIASGQKIARDRSSRETPTEASLIAISSDPTIVADTRRYETPRSTGADLVLGGGSLNGVITVGAGGNYASLTNSGGAFQAVNTQGLNGDLIINIISDLSAETGAVPLNQTVGAFSILIRPIGTRRTISGTSATNSAVVILAGADNVTIDGSLGNTDDRGLTITNDTAAGAVVWIQSAGAANGATGNTIRNCNLYGAGASNIIAGVLAGGPAFGTAAESQNSNNTIENVRVIKVQNGAYLLGAATFDQNWTIRNNDLGSIVAAEKLSFRGMLLGNANNFLITQNTIRGISSSTTTSSTMTGIQLANTCTNGSITRNFVTDVKHNNPSGFGANGIFIAQTSSAANLTVVNNIISDVGTIGFDGIGFGDNAYGIVLSAGSGYKLYHNSAYLTRYDPTIADAITAAINITSGVTATGAVELINNFFGDNQLTGTRYGIINAATQGSAVFTTIDYNDYFGQNVGRQGASTWQTLPLWQIATSQDIHSISVGVQFSSDTELHGGGALQNKATPLAAVTIDFDGESRPSGTGYDIGADEINFRADLIGRVLTSEGQPIANVRVIGTASGLGFSGVALTNGLGYFSFPNAQTATYTLTFISKGRTFSQPVVTFNHYSSNSSNYFADPLP